MAARHWSLVGLWLTLVVPLSVAAEPPPIRVPSIVAPAPRPAASPQLTLSADTVFVVDADVPVLVLASPEGRVGVTSEPGPIRVRARFVDEPDRIQTRTFSGKQVVFVEPLASGPCELLVVPVGAERPDQVIRRLLLVQSGPRPPPPAPVEPDAKDKDSSPAPNDDTPKDKDKDKDDKDKPAPIPQPGLRVLVVYDGAEAALSALPQGQQDILYGERVRRFLNDVCVVGPDGKTREWRIWPADVNAQGESAVWRNALARPRTSLPWLIVSNGTTGYEGPLPADADAFMVLVRRFVPARRRSFVRQFQPRRPCHV